MKPLLCILLVLLCLCGCAKEEAPPTEPSPGLYETEHAIETLTGGAVKAFPLEEYTFRGFAVMGTDYLLFGEGTLTLLSGENLTPITTVAAPGLPLPGSGQIQVNETGVCYYSSSENTVVYLGNTLLEVGRLHLTEQITGQACIAPGWNELYYCTEDSIRVLDLRTGTTKTLKQITPGWHSVTGTVMDGDYLCYAAKGTNEMHTYSLVNAQTGETAYQGAEFANIAACGQKYCLRRTVGPVTECIFGQGEEASQSLLFAAGEQILPLLENNAVIRLTETESGVKLEYFQLSTGLRSGEIMLTGMSQLQNICGDGHRVWFYWQDALYCWDPAQTPTDDETAYTAPHYTREAPDEAGLTALADTIVTLESRWGVDILYWEEPTAVIPWEGYRFETEYIPLVYTYRLAQLEQIMSQFPEDFFAQAVQWTGSPLQIVLVRGIYGSEEAGMLTSAPSIQYQHDGKSYLAVSMEGELDRAFYHGVSHLIETRILSTCTAYYEWNTLNPPGFRYDNDYIANQNRQDHQYLGEADRSFIDMYSMSFAMEDRARILEYACLPGNDAYFTAPVIQEKLRRICAGIREAFGLTGEAYLWEQYLAK